MAKDTYLEKKLKAVEEGICALLPDENLEAVISLVKTEMTHVYKFAHRLGRESASKY